MAQSFTSAVLVIAAAAALCNAVPLDISAGLNATHAVARGLVERASDYYCHTHCAILCHYESGWCCGVDDCRYGSHTCACYNVCYCGGSGYTYRCYRCDL